MEQARVWYGRAAEQGDVKAQCFLAQMHYNGEGGPVSMEQARVWHGRAAEQGVADAQYNLGILHANGIGGPVPVDFYGVTPFSVPGEDPKTLLMFV